MATKTCPRCDRTSLQYQENYGYWECLDCGHVSALDADDPDYEDSGDCPGCGGCGFVLDERGIECDCPICEILPFYPDFELF